MKLRKISKKAQMGETMTWVVATIIIIFMLMIFVYSSHALAKSKKVLPSNFFKDPTKDNNILEAKTAAAHKLAFDKNKEEIDNWISLGGKK